MINFMGILSQLTRVVSKKEFVGSANCKVVPGGTKRSSGMCVPMLLCSFVCLKAFGSFLVPKVKISQCAVQVV